MYEKGKLWDSVYELINMKLKFETCASGRDVIQLFLAMASNGSNTLNF